MKVRSIKGKVLLTAFLLIAVLFVIQRFYIEPLLEGNDRADLEINQAGIADHLAHSINLNFTAYINKLEVLARMPSVVSMKGAQIDKTLSQADELSPFFDYFFVIDPEGKWVSYPSKPYLVGKRVSNNNWIQETLAKNKTNFLDIHYADVINALVAGFATPIRDDRGKEVGVLRGVISISPSQETNVIFEMVRDFKFGNNGSTFLVDSQGRPLAHPDYSLSVDTFGESQLMDLVPVQRALAGESGTVEYAFQGKKYSASYRPIAATGWGLVVQQPVESIVAHVKGEVASITYLNYILILGCILFLGFIFISSIRPLRTLVESLQNNKFKTGSEYPKDEIGQLAEEIKKLFLSLNAAKEEIAQTLANQEKRIEERTRDLSESNEMLVDQIKKKEQAEKSLIESEERYRSLFENASDMIQTVRPDGQLLYVNPSWREVMGYTEEEALKLKVFDLIYPDSADQCDLHFRKTITDGTSGEMESVFQDKDGKKVILHGSANCKYGDDGKPSYVHCIFQNVTERRQMEDELVRMHKLESIGILAGGIAHDFNNILTAILGNLTLSRILSEKDPDKAAKRIAEAEKATLRAKDLTQQLLTFSKGGEPVKVTTSLNDIIIDSCQFVLRGSNVKCNFDLAEDLFLAAVDEGQISQVLHNLVVNADQAMPDGGVVDVHAENVRIGPDDDLPLSSGNYVLIKVEDNGSGISRKNLQRIFDPYFSTKHEGHGLGLATAYSIVKRHGGLLTVESKLGEGTVFKIYLPASMQNSTDRISGEEEIYFGKGSILLMDDEESVRETASELFNHLGYELVSAKDGTETLELYRKAAAEGNPYDVVILDLTVPGGMGGKETCEELLKIDPEMKIIVSSGYANNPIMANHEKYGFSGVMPKPYKIENASKILYELTNKDKGK